MNKEAFGMKTTKTEIEMTISYQLTKNVEQVINKTPEQVTFELIGDFGVQVLQRIKNLIEWAQTEPNATVNLSVKYDTEGRQEYEPSEEQRQQLSALAKIHKSIIDKVKSSTKMEDILIYGQMSNITMEMIKEIENETENN